jgi:hypothetical protein
MALRELGLGRQALETQLQCEAAELTEAFHQQQGKEQAFGGHPIPAHLYSHAHPSRGG